MRSPPSNLEDHLGYWLRKLSNGVSGAFSLRLEKHGVSVANWVVLRVLFGQDALTLTEMGRSIGVDQGALSRMVERLMKRGLVVRKENPRDRREVAISLTDPARKLVPKLAREAEENDREFFQSLSKRDREAFESTIKALLARNTSASPRHPID